MRIALLLVATAGVLLNGFLLKRLVALLASASPLPPVVRAHPASLQPDEGQIRRFLAPTLPILVPSLVAFPLFWFGQTWEEVVLGFLAIAVIIALGAPVLSPELLLWSHRARRLTPEREAGVLAGLRRLGLHPSEAWVSETPVVAFWEPAVHVPAVIVGSRVLMWDRVAELESAKLAGIALGHRVSFWPWALWPVAVAAGMRAIDSSTILPPWLFALPLALVVAGALPGAARALAIRRSVHTDSGVPDAIRGFLEIELACAAFIAARGDGFYHRFTARLAWTTGVQRARKAAHLAGMPESGLDAALGEAASTPLADVPQ